MINNNTFEFNSGAAVLAGPNNRIEHNALRFNGQYGLIGRDAHKAVIHRNELVGNNTAKVCFIKGGQNNGDGTFTPKGDCPAAGGLKLTHSLSTDIAFNCSLSNNGPGFWTDIANGNIQYYRNLAARNQRSGIYHEISFSADIHDNDLIANGTSQLYIK